MPSKNQHRARLYFQRDIKNHGMSVIRDDGVHRHLLFKAPSSFSYHFNIITYPGALVYEGDMGCFVFRRLEDMFEFFRTDSGRGDSINPDYWAQKLVGVDAHGSFEELDRDRYEHVVREKTIAFLRDHWDVTTKEERRKLYDAVVAEMIDGPLSEPFGVLDAYRMANDFFHEVKTSNGTVGFGFEDFWENDISDCTISFYWACYAIAWAVAQYDKAKMAPELAAAPAMAAGGTV